VRIISGLKDGASVSERISLQREAPRSAGGSRCAHPDRAYAVSTAQG
jgi:hypothetical protein